jgi:hypothetical protein
MGWIRFFLPILCAFHAVNRQEIQLTAEISMEAFQTVANYTSTEQKALLKFVISQEWGTPW